MTEVVTYKYNMYEYKYIRDFQNFTERSWTAQEADEGLSLPTGDVPSTVLRPEPLPQWPASPCRQEGTVPAQRRQTFQAELSCKAGNASPTHSYDFMSVVERIWRFFVLYVGWRHESRNFRSLSHSLSGPVQDRPQDATCERCQQNRKDLRAKPGPQVRSNFLRDEPEYRQVCIELVRYLFNPY